MQKMNRLQFSPRNKLLHDILRKLIIDAVYWERGVYNADIVVHHVSTIPNDALQFEYEVRCHNGKCSFHRARATIEKGEYYVCD